MIFFFTFGIIFGTFTGLMPGIHINLVGAIIVSLFFSGTFQFNPIYFIIFITSMAITHTFIDFIPSIFLGCPNTDTELSILPGHELLRKGEGYSAIMLTAMGGLIAIFALIIISFPLILITKKIYNSIYFLIPYILIFSSGIVVLTEKNRFKALTAFLLSGLLGLCVLNLPNLNQPLLPLLTGLFGGSMIVISIKEKIKIPKQKIKLVKSKILKPILSSLLASPLSLFLPALGSGQIAIIGNLFLKTDKKGFLVLLGATNTLVMGLSFISLYTISKARTGAAAAVQELISAPSTKVLILILITSLISGVISFFLIKKLSKFISTQIYKINYTRLSLVTIIILIIITFLVSGFLGLVILLVSTLTGIYCISLNVKRTNMMGCLLLPTILLYLF